MTTSQQPALAIKSLTKEYEGLTALHGIDLQLPPGQFLGLLGPNGAGKTTTINIVSGLAVKTAGQVQVFGHDLEKDFRACRRLVGLVPQEFNFDQFAQVRRILLFQGGYFGMPPKACESRADELLKLFELEDKAEVPARHLSGGMKRRLLIARALVHDPQLLILDEPTAGVDVDLRRTLWKFLRRLSDKGSTILLTTHYIEEAEALCDRISILHHGRIIAEDSTGNLVRKLSKETIAFTFDHPVASEDLPDFSDFRPDISPDLMQLKLTYDKAATSFNDLLQQVMACGVPLASVRPVDNPLEKVFLQLTTDQDKP